MKTSEFIKEIESMGLRVQKVEDYMFVIDILGFHVAKTSMKEFGLISTNDSEFIKLDYNAKLQLLNLLIEYAKTPIDDREEEEEKYYYRLKIIGYYLRYDIGLNKFYLGDYPYSSIYKTQFTDAEFEALPEDVKAHNWEKIRVEIEG